VQYAGAGADGWVSDVFELWVFEVRVSSYESSDYIYAYGYHF
jgi:hypothetical protein